MRVELTSQLAALKTRLATRNSALRSLERKHAAAQESAGTARTRAESSAEAGPAAELAAAEQRCLGEQARAVAGVARARSLVMAERKANARRRSLETARRVAEERTMLSTLRSGLERELETRRSRHEERMAAAADSLKRNGEHLSQVQREMALARTAAETAAAELQEFSENLPVSERNRLTSVRTRELAAVAVAGEEAQESLENAWAAARRERAQLEQQLRERKSEKRHAMAERKRKEEAMIRARLAEAEQAQQARWRIILENAESETQTLYEERRALETEPLSEAGHRLQTVAERRAEERAEMATEVERARQRLAECRERLTAEQKELAAHEKEMANEMSTAREGLREELPERAELLRRLLQQDRELERLEPRAALRTLCHALQLEVDVVRSRLTDCRRSQSTLDASPASAIV